MTRAEEGRASSFCLPRVLFRARLHCSKKRKLTCPVAIPTAGRNVFPSRLGANSFRPKTVDPKTRPQASASRRGKRSQPPSKPASKSEGLPLAQKRRSLLFGGVQEGSVSLVTPFGSCAGTLVVVLLFSLLLLVLAARSRRLSIYLLATSSLSLSCDLRAFRRCLPVPRAAVKERRGRERETVGEGIRARFSFRLLVRCN